MVLPITFMFVGGLLGLRFKVPILVPVIITASLAAFLVGMIQNENLETIALTSAPAVLMLQLGYLLGTLRYWSPALTRQNTFRLF